MKIAIIGAGLCGLGVACHLILNAPAFKAPLEISLFDEKEIAQGPSSFASGMLHPYAGAHAKLNWMGKEGFVETTKLLTIASQALGTSVILHKEGILRPALNSAQELDFRKAASKYPEDISWFEHFPKAMMPAYFPSCAGIWIQRGCIIDVPLYLQGLWKACSLKGVVFKNTSIASLKALSNFCLVIVTAGAKTCHFQELASLPIKKVKGSILKLKWHLSPFPYPFNSQGQLIMDKGHKSCTIGSTYERDNLEEHTDIHQTRLILFPQMKPLLPFIEDLAILNCKSGFRAVTPNHLPFISSFQSRYWILTGMGSKGLLYHALMAKQLVSSILKANAQ